MREWRGLEKPEGEKGQDLELGIDQNRQMMSPLMNVTKLFAFSEGFSKRPPRASFPA